MLLGVIGLAAVFWLLLPDLAQAYLDPGSGSYFIQVLIGLVSGLIFAVRSAISRWFNRLKAFFRPPPKPDRRPKHRKRP